MSGLVLGVDPGLTGALAVMQHDTIIALMDIPTVGEGAKRRINVPLLRDWVTSHRPHVAYIEAAAAMPRQGVSSTFRYGRAVGTIEAVVACCGVRLELVSPVTWKRACGLIACGKEDSRALAVRLWPEMASEWFSRKGDHGRSEACLIARYGLMVERGGPTVAKPMVAAINGA